MSSRPSSNTSVPVLCKKVTKKHNKNKLERKRENSMLHDYLGFFFILLFIFFLEETNTSGISVHHIRDESQACRLEGHSFFFFALSDPPPV